MLCSLLTGIAWAQGTDNGGRWVPEKDETEPRKPSPLDRDTTGLGLGVILGLPTGLAFAWRPDKGPLWADASVAWNFGRSYFHVHGDLLLEVGDASTNDIPDFRFPLFIGVGGRTQFAAAKVYGTGGLQIGVRVPLGMAVQHNDVPIEAWIELAPGLNFLPATLAFLDAAIGVRYYVPFKPKKVTRPTSSAPPVPA